MLSSPNPSRPTGNDQLRHRHAGGADTADPQRKADTNPNNFNLKCTPSASDTPNLFDILPQEVLESILSGGYGRISPTDLVELACSCKAVATVTLPILYSSILVPSLSALARLYPVLVAKPDLAQHVRSLTASQYFAEIGQFAVMSDVVGDAGKVDVQSFIVSVQKVQQRCDPKLLDMMPMAWFTRIARICPNLVSVDISRIPSLEAASPCLTFGLLDLARILRARGGRFASSPLAPFSAVAVNDLVGAGQHAVRFAPTLFLITRMDWGSKQIDIANDVGHLLDTGELALVPFSDLTSTSLDEQNAWTIRKAEITAFVSPSCALGPPQDAWIRFGIRNNGADRVFDLSRPGEIAADTGSVSFKSIHIGSCRTMLDRRQVHVNSQCSKVYWIGQDPRETFMTMGDDPDYFDELVEHLVDVMVPQFVSQPWLALTDLVASNAFWLTLENTASTLQLMADGMPNLTLLELRNLHIPMDAVMYHLDCFIRRPAHRGTALRALHVSAFSPDHDDPTMCTAWFPLPTLQPLRTPLDATKTTPHRLHTLELHARGPGAHELWHYEAPTVAIHPGLLHGIQRLIMQYVKLVVIPPHAVDATSASFLPLSAFSANPSSPITHRTPLTLEHVCLPQLTWLEINSHSLAPLTTTDPYPPYRLPTALPRAPNLAQLLLGSADTSNPRGSPFSAKHVLPTLVRYPKLVRVRLGHTALSEAHLHAIVGTIQCPPRVLSPLPRLRTMILDNLHATDVIGGERGDFSGQFVNVPHLVDMMDSFALAPTAHVQLSPSSVEAALPAVSATTPRYLNGNPVQSAACGKCGKLVDLFDDRETMLMSAAVGGFARLLGLAGMSKRDMMAMTTHTMCPECGPRASARVWRDGSASGRGSGRAPPGEPSMWSRSGTRKERLV